MVDHGPMRQWLAWETTTIMTEHTQYNLPPMADESCATGDTSNPHQSPQTHSYSIMQQNSHTQEPFH